MLAGTAAEAVDGVALGAGDVVGSNRSALRWARSCLRACFSARRCSFVSARPKAGGAETTGVGDGIGVICGRTMGGENAGPGVAEVATVADGAAVAAGAGVCIGVVAGTAGVRSGRAGVVRADGAATGVAVAAGRGALGAFGSAGGTTGGVRGGGVVIVDLPAGRTLARGAGEPGRG